MKYEKIFEAKAESFPAFNAFMEECMEAEGCPMKIQVGIQVAVEEIFVNVAHYAYPEKDGMVTVVVVIENSCISIELTDNGVPFNPLSKEDPDITLALEEREIGGLGIYMVKKMMDEVSYKYEDGKNIFKMIKKY